MSVIRNILNGEPSSALAMYPTVGQVVDTNDPQEMGRVRVMCPALGDTPDMLIKDIPWATYIAPFGGVTNTGSRGRTDEDFSTGPVAYGMWAIPKVGATALVMCVDGDTRFRIFLGCMHGQYLTHTMPHGRFGYNSDFGDGDPAGPVTSEEFEIEPSSRQLELAFTKSQDNLNLELPSTPKSNFEYRTRGADRSVSRIDNELVDSNFNSVSWTADDENATFSEEDGNSITHTQGYQPSRQEPGTKNTVTGENYDSQIYSVTTPGFHSISMDDSSDNCRVRIRTTHGSQIIMDDTNERIYISTAQGDTWIEMDEKGNIDIYGKRNISFHAEGDFNITADTIRMKAKTGIHAISEGEMRLHAKSQDMHIIADQTLRVHAETDVEIKAVGGTLYFEAGTNIDAKAGAAGIFEAAGGDLNLKASANTNLDAGSTSNIKAGSGNVLVTGTQIHLNGPGAGSATAGTGVTESAHKEAFWTSRVPEHEPWGRIMTDPAVTDLDVDNTHADAGEYFYEDSLVGRIERGVDLQRNPKWHR